MINLSTALWLVPTVCISYVLLTAIHRLYFCRISHIPGPRLAALTYFYQFYYDVYPQKGQFMFHCGKLHELYGPIIRIGPDEVHINDIPFYNEVYTGNARRRDKSPLWFWMSGVDEFSGRSTFVTLDHDLHRQRRSAFGQYFSRGKVLELQPKILEKVEQLRDVLLKHAGTDTLIELKDACGALTLEVITDYTFGRVIPVLDSPDMAHSYNDLSRVGVRIHPIGRAFPWLTRRMLTLPKWVMEGNPMYDMAQRFDQKCKDITTEAYNDAMMDHNEKTGTGHTTVIGEMAHSDNLSPEDKTLQRLKNDGSIFIGAGMETTGRTLAVTFFNILNDATVLRKLQDELRPLIPTSSSPAPTLAALEKLPYLTAVLTEGIRVAHGTAGRLARIAPDEDLICHGYKIPRGTTMSQSSYLLHTDPAVFPDPLGFHPERFLGPKAAEVQKNMVPFGRGARMCVGMNLAWAEMYLTVAVLVMSMKMELVETTIRDATVNMEFFIGCLPDESKGIRVKILGKA